MQGPVVLERFGAVGIVAGLVAAVGLLPYVHEFDPDESVGRIADSVDRVRRVRSSRSRWCRERRELVPADAGDAFGAMLIGLGLLNMLWGSVGFLAHRERRGGLALLVHGRLGPGPVRVRPGDRGRPARGADHSLQHPPEPPAALPLVAPSASREGSRPTGRSTSSWPQHARRLRAVRRVRRRVSCCCVARRRCTGRWRWSSAWACCCGFPPSLRLGRSLGVPARPAGLWASASCSRSTLCIGAVPAAAPRAWPGCDTAPLGAGDALAGAGRFTRACSLRSSLAVAGRDRVGSSLTAGGWAGIRPAAAAGPRPVLATVALCSILAAVQLAAPFNPVPSEERNVIVAAIALAFTAWAELALTVELVPAPGLLLVDPVLLAARGAGTCGAAREPPAAGPRQRARVLRLLPLKIASGFLYLLCLPALLRLVAADAAGRSPRSRPLRRGARRCAGFRTAVSSRLCSFRRPRDDARRPAAVLRHHPRGRGAAASAPAS